MYKLIEKTIYIAIKSNMELKQANPNGKKIVRKQLKTIHFLVFKICEKLS